MYNRDEIYFHNFLTGMRTDRNVTLEQLSLGLCSAAMLSLIEADKRQPDEYELWQNRARLLRAVDARDMPEAERLLGALEQEVDDRNVVLFQFIMTMRAQLMQYQGAPREEMREIFGKALSLTVPDVASGAWDRYLLAAQEWNLLLEYIRCGGDAGPVTEAEPSDTYTIRALEKLLSAMRGSSMDSYSYAKVCPKAVYFLCLELLKAPLDSAACHRLLRISAEAVETLRSCQRMYWLYELLELMERVLSIYSGLIQPGTKEHAPAPFDQAWDRLCGKTAELLSPADVTARELPEDPESLALLSA